MINQKRGLMVWVVLFCTFLNIGRTLEAAASKEIFKVKMVNILRQIPEVYQLDDRLNEGNFRDAFQLLGADLTKRVQEYQDVALAQSLSRGDKGKEEAIVGNVSGGDVKPVSMLGALSLPQLFLLDALRGIQSAQKLISQEDLLNKFYVGMPTGSDSNVFKSVFNNPESRFYMKSSFWNINFKSDYDLLMSKLEKQFKIDADLRVNLGIYDFSYLNSASQYWNASNWGSGQSSGDRFSIYSQPDGFAQRYIVSETRVQPVTHQGRGDLATNNCGLHALINAGLFLKNAPDKDFIQNHDKQINKARTKLVESYKDREESEEKIEQALHGNLDSMDLFNAVYDLGLNGPDDVIMISIPEQIKQIAQNNFVSLEDNWKENFEKKMRAFCQSDVGSKIVFLFNVSEYAVQEDLRKRLADVTQKSAVDVKNAVELDLFNVFNQHDQVGHWITVMFEKTEKIDTRGDVDRYLVKTTLADSLAGSHYKDATFLQLFFLQQLKKYEGERKK